MIHRNSVAYSGSAEECGLTGINTVSTSSVRAEAIEATMLQIEDETAGSYITG